MVTVHWKQIIVMLMHVLKRMKDKLKSEYKRKLIVKKRNGGKTEVLGGNYHYWNYKKCKMWWKKVNKWKKKVAVGFSWKKGFEN